MSDVSLLVFRRIEIFKLTNFEIANIFGHTMTGSLDKKTMNFKLLFIINIIPFGKWVIPCCLKCFYKHPLQWSVDLSIVQKSWMWVQRRETIAVPAQLTK